jgi:leucyl/phenylalanyl-tRNA--protein transferase
MVEGYCALHRAGDAHCVEAWLDGRLVGGAYGVTQGRIFCGESMFSLEPNASKVAFTTLARALFETGYQLIDCQIYTDHSASFGAVEIPREAFELRLRVALGGVPTSVWPG